MALSISWSFSCISARRAAWVGEVSRPSSISASEAEFACSVPRWRSDTSWPASLI